MYYWGEEIGIDINLMSNKDTIFRGGNKESERDLLGLVARLGTESAAVEATLVRPRSGQDPSMGMVALLIESIAT